MQRNTLNDGKGLICLNCDHVNSFEQDNIVLLLLGIPHRVEKKAMGHLRGILNTYHLKFGVFLV